MPSTRNNFDMLLPPGPIFAHLLNGQHERDTVSKPGYLRGTRILDSRQLTDEQNARLRTTLTATNTFGGEGARCFIPGIGFTVGHGEDAVEILICLRCDWVYFFRAELQMIEAISDEGNRRLMEFYTELFPGENPDNA